MAGDWIKWVKGLTRRDEVVRIAMLLKRDRRYVASLCMEFWEWVDESTVDGFLPAATVEQVDIIVDSDGFGSALAAVGWITSTPEGIRVANFDRHNGESAKSRALSALRKAKQRKDATERDKCHGDSVTQAGQVSRSERDKSVTREEKRREEKSIGLPFSLGSSTNTSPVLTTVVATDGGNPPPAAPPPPQTTCGKVGWDAGTGFTGISVGIRLAWERAFPACDIDAELAKAHAWMLANPKKIKRNWQRFLHEWLARTQDRGGTGTQAGNRAPRAVVEPAQVPKSLSQIIAERQAAAKQNGVHA